MEGAPTIAKIYNPRLPIGNNHAARCGNKSTMLFVKALHSLLEMLSDHLQT